MCGITGFWSPSLLMSEPELTSIVSAMALEIQARGPDDGGAWVDGEQGLALGQRRLSIVDLSHAGHQPMMSACGRYVMIYNGELYNTHDLRQEILREKVITFRGTSDTEVLVEACALWGLRRTLPKTNGMFAIAVWDRQGKTLSLARDRMGEKPLYYGWQGEGSARTFFFGSQLKSFKPHPHWVPKVDAAMVTSFLRYGYVPAPRTIYEGMSQVVPGEMLVVTADGHVHKETYWCIEDHITSTPLRQDPVTVVNDLDGLLKDAVGRRMMADVPLGAFLSGGIDSSLIVSLMQSQSTTPVKTFSVGFEQKEFDEAPYAKAIAQHLGTDHTELYLPVEAAADVIPLLPQMYDEPFADSSQIPTYLVSKMARSHVTVALSGDGGDELFAGYNRYFYSQKVWGALGPYPPFAKRLLGSVFGLLSETAWDRCAGLLPASHRPKFLGQKVSKVIKLLNRSNEQGVYQTLISQSHSPELYSLSGQEENVWGSYLGREDFDSFVAYMQYLDMKTYLPNDILTKVDRASMAVSLEGRIPLLDHRVIEFALSLPVSMNIQQGQAKWPLRQLLSRYVPRPLFERPKSGFGIPLHDWLRGRLRDWGEDLMSVSSLQNAGLLNVSAVRSLWEGYQKGLNQEAYALWTMLMLQAWHRESAP